MRSRRVGIFITLVLSFTALSSSAASAQSQQVKGEVESIGFNNAYRPDAHTPMVVRVNPNGAETGLYQLQVHQKDLDGDDVIYYRPISITGGEGGREQRYWMDFLPNPGELPDFNRGDQLRDLQKDLNVYLCTNSGKQLALLKVTSSIASVDPKPGINTSRRGSKFILCVTDGTRQPSWYEYQNTQDLLGVLEDVTVSTLRTADLPENPVEYDAIDAVVWFGADPADLKRGGDAKYRALESYIRTGGHLVICQSPEWQKFLDFGALLPVQLQGVAQSDQLEPLKTLAHSTGPRTVYRNGKTEVIEDPWDKVKGPFVVARAVPKPNTIVDQTISWDAQGKNVTPYIVRQPYGIGAVSWVAQDLGDPTLTKASSMVKTTGWVYIWDKVFDWKNDPIVARSDMRDDEKRVYARANAVDVGQALVRNTMEIPSKAGLFIATAIAFFLVYWGVAGPGFYVYLVQKRRPSLSWFMFALSAVVATAATVLVVKLVLRGPPELHHVSFVTAATADPGHSAVVRSRFGLYIPRDGDQRIQLQNTATDAVSTINAFAIHPAHLVTESAMPSPQEYTVPVRDLSSTDPPAIVVPYRSTLKKFEATWVGPLTGRVEGTGKVIRDGDQFNIAGSVTNATGIQLRNVYFAVKLPVGDRFEDQIYYLPTWDPGVTVDLAKDFSKDDRGDTVQFVSVDTPNRTPDAGKRLKGPMLYWREYWLKQVKRSSSSLGDSYIADLESRAPVSLPMMTFFDRLSPMKNQTGGDPDRAELIRRGGRHLDRSVSIAAGSMVVLAQAPGKLPFPMTVESDPVGGEGQVFYQFVLPVDRSATAADAAPAPATQPAGG